MMSFAKLRSGSGDPMGVILREITVFDPVLPSLAISAPTRQPIPSACSGEIEFTDNPVPTLDPDAIYRLEFPEPYYETVTLVVDVTVRATRNPWIFDFRSVPTENAK